MHDTAEGVCPNTAEKVLTKLVDEDILSLDEINMCIDTFPYSEAEKKNKPRPLYFYKGKSEKKKIKRKNQQQR